MEDKHIASQMEQGWNEMKVVLDHELPVRKRKNRIFLYLWLSMIIVGFILGFIMYLNFSNQNVESKSKNNQTIATTLVKDADVTTSVPLIESIKEKQPEFASSTLLSKYNRPSQNKNIIQTSGQVASLDKKSEDSTIHNYDGVNENVEMPSGESHVDEYNISDVTEILSGLDSVITNDEITILLPSVVSLISVSQNQHLMKQSLIMQKSRPYQLGLSVGVNSHDYRSILSYRAGFFFDKYIHEKWKITSGMSWRRYVQNSDLFSLIQSETLNPAGGEISGNSIFDLSYENLNPADLSAFDFEILNQITKKVDYAELHLGCGYQLFRQLDLNLAVNMAYQVTSKYETGTINSKEFMSAKILELTQNNINNALPLHKKFIASIQAGLSARVASCLYLTAMVNYMPYKDNIRSLNNEKNELTPVVNYSFSIEPKKDHRLGIEFGLKYIMFEK